MPLPGKGLFEFGSFRVDPAERLLTHAGKPVALTPKAFETLLVLLENAGHALNKDDLLKRVWPDTFVEEATLAKNISTLRKALGDDDNGSRYIETIPKFGYRFATTVRFLEPDTFPVVSARASPLTEASPGAVAEARRGWRWLAGGVVVLLLAVTAYFVWRHPRAGGAASSRRVLLAVLPFQNLSDDESQEYFADGLTEEMIAQLSRLYPERLAVIARTSAMKYKGANKGVAAIGSELGADYILEGSVRREGNRVRISSQLVRVSDQTNLWAETDERELREVLALQAEVARGIAGSIGIELTEENRVEGLGTEPISPDAYENYLKGRFFSNKMTVSGFERAIQHFEAAIHKNPRYAEAFAGLADAYASLGLWGLPGRDALRQAKAAAEKAVAIRETLAEGHASRAFIAMSYEWDWETAEREFQRALVLNPGYASAHHRYGYYLMLRGRWDEAGAELKKAQELDPLSMLINANVGFRLYLMRQYDAALEHWNRNLELDPDFPLLHGYKGMAYVMKESYPEALAEFERARDTPGAVAALGYTYGVMGRTQEARKQLAALRELAKQKSIPAFYVALLHTGLGDKHQAFAWLDKAYEERSGYLMEIHVDPMFDPLRSDPRFQALTRRLGLEAAPPIR